MSDEKIGYKSPPKHRRFKKGQSGNPSGRPKKRNTFLDDLHEELQIIIAYVENGQKLNATKQRLLVKKMTNLGLGGNVQMLREIIRSADKLNAKIENMNITDLLERSKDMSAIEAEKLYMQLIKESRC